MEKLPRPFAIPLSTVDMVYFFYLVDLFGGNNASNVIIKVNK